MRFISVLPSGVVWINAPRRPNSIFIKRPVPVVYSCIFLSTSDNKMLFWRRLPRDQDLPPWGVIRWPHNRRTVCYRGQNQVRLYFCVVNCDQVGCFLSLSSVSILLGLPSLVTNGVRAGFPTVHWNNYSLIHERGFVIPTRINQKRHCIGQFAVNETFLNIE